jgi:hypothetical protein
MKSLTLFKHRRKPRDFEIFQFLIGKTLESTLVQGLGGTGKRRLRRLTANPKLPDTNPGAIAVSGTASLNDVALSVANPAASIPVIGTSESCKRYRLPEARQPFLSFTARQVPTSST